MTLSITDKRGIHLENSSLIDEEMADLEAAAEAGDEQRFLSAQQAMAWDERPAEDFIRAIQLALSASAYLAARRLAAQGAEHYPQHAELQKYAHILAPPRVAQNNLPSDPTLKTNHEWIMSHRNSFRGQWVALQDGQLLSSADSLESLVDQVGDIEVSY